MDSHSRTKQKCLILLLAWTLVSGGVYGIVDVEWEKPLRFLDAIVFAVATIKWTQHDALQHKFPLSRYFILLMVICPGPLLVMPVYFVKSRGWSSGLVAILTAIGLIALLMAVDYAASYVTIELFWGD